MIKAGWKLEFRVHGLTLSKPEIIVKAALAKPNETPDLEVTLEFSSELKYPIGVIALPRYVPAGEQQLPLTPYRLT